MQAKIWLVAAGMLMSGTAMAWEVSKAEYSADSYIETAETIIKGRVYAASGKERREYNEGGEQMAMILRRDKKVGWMLIPEQKMYMEMKLDKDGGRKDDLAGWQIEQTKIGPETVNGVKTMKSKIIMTGPKGEKMGGFWWITNDNIVVKLDAISVNKGSKDRFKIELKDLKVARQDPALFEVPNGYKKMDMGMGALGSMLGGGGQEEGDKPKNKSKNKESEGGFGFQDALKLLR